jgi:hypothetical protein
LFSEADIPKEYNAMQKFIAKLGGMIQGVISGADRLVFREVFEPYSMSLE